jgi:outer membrane lipoprotein-sorting protein
VLFAQTPSLPSLQELAVQFGKVTTIQSRFTQENHLSLLTEPVTSEGKFVFQKNPSLLRWEYTKPFENGFLMTAEKSYRLEKGQKKELKGALLSTIISQMQTWLTLDIKELQKKYRIAQTEGMLVFTPLSDDTQSISQITLWFTSEELPRVTKLELAEPTGDKTVLYFTDTMLNKEISAESVK